jgi:thiosulfate dehydrogenase [quinone] large subunit
MSKSFITLSWKGQPLSITVLRLWLGITWVYGGWDKATDPGFLNPSSGHYIGAQLTGYLQNSPISFLLRKMIEHATIVGWVVMISEFAIGIAVLSGIALSLAALGGAGMSATLWLTATWSVKPYFLGSDTAYLVMWIVLFVSLHQSYRVSATRSEALRHQVIPRLKDRREVMRLVAVAGAAILAAGSGTLLKRKIIAPVIGTPIVNLSAFSVGSTFNFVTKDGSPAILFRTKVGVFAYSAICTHQGCTVAYSKSSHLIECPCHISRFDPNNGAAVLSGPAPLPLPKISVLIQGDNVVQV